MKENSQNNNFNYNNYSHNKNDYFFNGHKNEKERISSEINKTKQNNINNAPKSISDNLIDNKSNASKEIKTSNKIGSTLMNTGINAASQSENGLVRTAGKTAKGIENITKFIKKAAVFFSTPFGWITMITLAVLLGIILIVIVVQLIISSLSLKYGLSEDSSYETFSEKYELRMSTEEIDEIFETNGGLNCGSDSTLLYKLFGITSNATDYCLYIKKLLAKNEYKNLKPGYFLSTLYYAYETASSNIGIVEDNDGNTYDLNDIAITSLLIKNDIYTKESIEELLSNILIHNSYTYKISKIDEEGSTSCEEKESEDSYSVSDTKFKLFLRYGKEVADAYEEDINYNNSIDRTSTSCRDNSVKRDLSKYEIASNELNEENDNAKIVVNGVTYGYNSGFIYKTYPRYKEAGQTYNYLIDKEIESIISDITERKEYVNYILGYQSSLFEDEYETNYQCGYDLKDKTISNLKVRLLYGGNGIDESKRNLVGTPIEKEDLIPYEDYIYGVVYHEIGIYDQDMYAESWKAQAIMARSFGLRRPYEHNSVNLEKENGQWILSIRNSNDDMAYCNPDIGCYTCPGYGTNTFSANALPEGLTTESCKLWMGPHQRKNIMKRHVDETRGILLYKQDGNVALSGWLSSTYKILDLAKDGKDYTEMLQIQYDGEYTISKSECTGPQNGTLSDTKKEEYINTILNKYPNISNERLQAITIALNSYGLPYFWGGGHGSLEDMIDVAENKWGKDYCQIIHDGLTSQPLGSMQLCGFDCSGFVRYIMYASTGIDPGAAGTGNIGSNDKYTLIEENELLPGDIGLINGTERESGIGHVGIFMYKDDNGRNVYIHESRGVEIGYPTFTKYRRYIYMD